MSYVRFSSVRCVLGFVCLSVSICIDICVSVYPCLKRHLWALHLFEYSPCVKIQDVELFPWCPWRVDSIALSWGYHTREGSLALASKYMHMPPLTFSVPSHLHAIMRCFKMWCSKIIFLMFERAWLGFSFKDFVSYTVYCHVRVSHFSYFYGDTKLWSVSAKKMLACMRGWHRLE